ncbi:hypothetical protein [Neorhodopirellula lusitana]|uniref:hypothetical protein n=1 Tax=Neorhodopirellula lusitana TaxID=445327 RepID=UPI00384C890B
MPSSRTPEGDPASCPVCGLASAIEPSIPPGDCVCPHCGSHLWMTPKETSTKTAIRSFVRELQALVSADDSTTYTSGFLVAGLRRCLAAHGASLWIATEQGFLRRQQPRLVRNDGHPASYGFARDVIVASESIVRREFSDNDAYLHLGVPISRKTDILGVIEIAQRDVRDEHIQCGYTRFVTQMAEVSIPLAAKLQNG